MCRFSLPLVEMELDTGEDDCVSSRSNWSLTGHNSEALDVSDVSSLSADVTHGGHGRRRRRAGCAAGGLFPGTHNHSAARFTRVLFSSGLENIEHRSSLDPSRHGREWPAKHPGSRRTRALRANRDTRAPRQRLEARVGGDHDAPFACRLCFPRTTTWTIRTSLFVARLLGLSIIVTTFFS